MGFLFQLMAYFPRNFMELLFWPMAYFIHPTRAFWVAGFFLALLMGSGVRGMLDANRAKRIRLWPLMLPLGTWTLYGVWERSLVGKGYNIRVDLLMIYPVLVVSTVVGLVLWIRNFRKPAEDTSVPDRPRRSRVLTAVGILLMLWGGWGVWASLWIIPATVAGLRDTRAWHSGYVVVALGEVLMRVGANGLGYLVSGIGVLQRKRWARVLVVWLAVTLLLWDICTRSASFLIIGFSYPFWIIRLSHLFWYLFLLWFCTRPAIKSQLQ